MVSKLQIQQSVPKQRSFCWLVLYIHMVEVIWNCRNQVFFHNHFVPWQPAASLLFANVSLLGHLTSSCMRSSLNDFQIIKAFNIIIRAPSAKRITQISWHPPLFSWIKCNSDEATKGNLGHATYGGLFCDHSSGFLGGFTLYHGICSQLIWSHGTFVMLG